MEGRNVQEEFPHTIPPRFLAMLGMTGEMKREPSLEDVFVAMVGRGLGENGA